MAVYYNEFDPFAAAWLKQLMTAGEIPQGDIDTRSMIEVTPDDIKEYTQCHFFAGIGGWSLALKIAGWPDDRPVWTGSCPCQPFSTAGRQKGNADERHLWPVWFNLIRECKPPVVFGEQVAAAITKGWLDSVYDDMESEGYAIGSAILPACSVGAPHRRERLWFVGYAEHDGYTSAALTGSERQAVQYIEERQISTLESEGTGATFDVANPFQSRLEGRLSGRSDSQREDQHGHSGCGSAGSLRWIECPDGKARPVKFGICLLANGVPNRVGKLRGYGNAIVPQVAAEFIRASY